MTVSELMKEVEPKVTISTEGIDLRVWKMLSISFIVSGVSWKLISLI